MKKKLFLLFFLFAFAINITPVHALDITSEAAIVIDINSGKAFYESNADTPLAPASMTKVMTVYLIYESINNGTLSKDTLITADEEDHIASTDPVATNVYLETGESYSVDELIGAILVPSACAASAMVGKYISGSEAAFAELMTQTAAELGLTAYYEDASGLSDNNRITARSMAKLVSILINKYPDVLNYTSEYHISFGGKQYRSTNRMLPEGSMPYPGVNGFKTGTTTLAGRCFAASAVNDGIHLVSVTMHSGYGTARFSDTKKLLDLGFTEAALRYNNLYSTDLKVYINGFELPTFCYTGTTDHLVVIAEDLSDYGFDVSWNGASRSLSVQYAPDKAVYPIDTEPYKQYGSGNPILPIYKTNTTVDLSYNGDRHMLKDIYDLSGYIAVSADELSSIAKSTYWDNEKGSLYIQF